MKNKNKLEHLDEIVMWYDSWHERKSHFKNIKKTILLPWVFVVLFIFVCFFWHQKTPQAPIIWLMIAAGFVGILISVFMYILAKRSQTMFLLSHYCNVLVGIQQYPDNEKYHAIFEEYNECIGILPGMGIQEIQEQLQKLPEADTYQKIPSFIMDDRNISILGDIAKKAHVIING